ncbi:hypothetical protein BJ741DRAFT_380802 [Chytriomyces cf. hyalinus JEL632]|nr:hypothetical protein BJ741DRAFT_380802 [Chytriomyces cf. hyalinus JEL632]
MRLFSLLLFYVSSLFFSFLLFSSSLLKHLQTLQTFTLHPCSCCRNKPGPFSSFSDPQFYLPNKPKLQNSRYRLLRLRAIHNPRFPGVQRMTDDPSSIPQSGYKHSANYFDFSGYASFAESVCPNLLTSNSSFTNPPSSLSRLDSGLLIIDDIDPG